MRRFATLVLATAMATCAATALQAADWPSKPITYMVPFPPGGTTDVLARLIGPKLSAVLGQPIVVDNKPGAGGGVGSEIASRAAPDGYTILGVTISSHAINASLYPNLPYDPVKQFVPITLIGVNPLVLVVTPGNPANTVKDLIAQAKAKPGMNFASAGNGTSQHLAGELFKMMAGVSIEHVPYKGSAPAIQDVMGGTVPMMFDTTVVANPQVKAGKVKALGVTAKERIASLPDVPPVADSVPGFEVVSWQGIMAPAGTPADIVKRLNTEIVKIIRSPEILEKLDGLGVTPVANTSEEFAAFQKAEIVKWAKVVKEGNIKVD